MILISNFYFKILIEILEKSKIDMRLALYFYCQPESRI